MARVHLAHGIHPKRNAPVPSKLGIPALLDPVFLQVALYNCQCAAVIRATEKGVPLVIGPEREAGIVSRFETIVAPASIPHYAFPRPNSELILTTLSVVRSRKPKG